MDSNPERFDLKTNGDTVHYTKQTAKKKLDNCRTLQVRTRIKHIRNVWFC